MAGGAPTIQDTDGRCGKRKRDRTADAGRRGLRTQIRGHRALVKPRRRLSPPDAEVTAQSRDWSCRGGSCGSGHEKPPAGPNRHTRRGQLGTLFRDEAKVRPALRFERRNGCDHPVPLFTGSTGTCVRSARGHRRPRYRDAAPNYSTALLLRRGFGLSKGFASVACRGVAPQPPDRDWRLWPSRPRSAAD